MLLVSAGVGGFHRGFREAEELDRDTVTHTHTHTHTHTVDILIVKLLIKHRFSEDKSFCTDLVSCLLSLFVPLV